MDIDTNVIATLVPMVAGPEELDLDGRNLYISDETDQVIHVASIDTGVATVYASGLDNPEGVQFDAARQRVYYSNKDGGTIRWVDSTGAGAVILGGLQEPDGLAYHAGLDTLFYTERLAGIIGRVDPDGSNQSTIVSGRNNPEAIGLHEELGQMFWLETSKVSSANIDGSGVVDIVPSDVDSGEGLALDKVRGQVYWSEDGSRTLNRAELDGSNETVIHTASAKLEGVAL